MNKELLAALGNWPKGYIHDADLAILLSGTDAARYAIVKRAVRDGLLVRLRKGLYLIDGPFQRLLPDLFELAIQFCSPSYVSLESALSYHGWIPEAVPTVRCVTPKRKRMLITSIGTFSFSHTPARGFFEGVKRMENPTFFMATPWKALADLAYTRKVSWSSLGELSENLRIERETMEASDLNVLERLAEDYSSARVRQTLQVLLSEVGHGK